jgi:hypothetical protein
MSSIHINTMSSIYSNQNIIITGVIETTTPCPSSITLPPLVSTLSNHIILDKNNEKLFKFYMGSAPVIREQSVHLYDQYGNSVCRYEVGRLANSPGTVEIVSEPVSLLNNIVFPRINTDTQQLFMPIISYPALTQTTVPEYQRQLVIEDMRIWSANMDLSQLNIIIGEAIYNIIIKYVPDFNTRFKTTVVMNDVHVMPYLIEFLCGKIILGQKPSFQGFLHFGTGYEVLQATCIADPSLKHQPVQLIARRNGRVQINVNAETGTGIFLIVLKMLTMDIPPMFVEETTGRSFTIDIAKTSHALTSFTDAYIKEYVDALNFYNELMEIKDTSRYMDYKDFVVKYLFTNPSIMDATVIKSLNSFAQLLHNDFIRAIEQIQTQLFKMMPPRIMRKYGDGGFMFSPQTQQLPTTLGRNITCASPVLKSTISLPK